MVNINKTTSKLLLIIVAIFLLVPELSAGFIDNMDKNNEKIVESITSNISLGGKIFFGLLPFAMAIGFILLVKKFGKKQLMAGNEDDKWIYYGSLVVASIAGFFLGWYAVELMGSFLLGDSEKAQKFFNDTWAQWLGLDQK